MNDLQGVEALIDSFECLGDVYFHECFLRKSYAAQEWGMTGWRAEMEPERFPFRTHTRMESRRTMVRVQVFLVNQAGLSFVAN